MKLLTLLLLPITATALQTTNPITATDDNNPTPSLKVPGRNPLTYCEDPLASKHILLIKSVDLEPNPPEAGTPLSIKATGNFTREVVEGAYVNLSVKLGLITLLRRREDLCAQLKEVEKECPLEVGETSISREVDLPSVIPPGKFTVSADVFDKDDKIITCLRAEIQFHKKAGGIFAGRKDQKNIIHEQVDMEIDGSVDL